MQARCRQHRFSPAHLSHLHPQVQDLGRTHPRQPEMWGSGGSRASRSQWSKVRLELEITASGGDRQSGKGDKDPSLYSTNSSDNWKGPAESFLSGRRRARAADKSLDPQRGLS